ncbi:hypothetical protein ZHAS_00008021 [Anopheles sinensis]|uniref:Uncharacterized protein n=1 Tax=Anopheles sinensis TaxID=74873 RepID=A0A084VRD3_ANOSI|nr:hypothetical protein ZHAS_00008021 [Anopheles sinensis]
MKKGTRRANRCPFAPKPSRIPRTSTPARFPVNTTRHANCHPKTILVHQYARNAALAGGGEERREIVLPPQPRGWTRASDDADSWMARALRTKSLKVGNSRSRGRLNTGQQFSAVPVVSASTLLRLLQHLRPTLAEVSLHWRLHYPSLLPGRSSETIRKL